MFTYSSIFWIFISSVYNSTVYYNSNIIFATKEITHSAASELSQEEVYKFIVRIEEQFKGWDVLSTNIFFFLNWPLLVTKGLWSRVESSAQQQHIKKFITKFLVNIYLDLSAVNQTNCAPNHLLDKTLLFFGGEGMMKSSLHKSADSLVL